MSKLSYISDSRLYELVAEVLQTIKNREQSIEEEIDKNVIDPFTALFDAMRIDKGLDDWLLIERTRQIQKTLSNKVGEFHQKLLGSVDGWTDPGRAGSIDLINEDRKIIAEIKNKHNTMNSSSQEATYNKLVNHLQYQNKGYTAYLVNILPKLPRRNTVEWSPNLHKMLKRPDILLVDGASFYTLVTGDNNALNNLFQVLPGVISEVIGSPLATTDCAAEFAVLFEKAYGSYSQ